MPQIQIDPIEGRIRSELGRVADAVHEAIVLNVEGPASRRVRFQIVAQKNPCDVAGTELRQTGIQAFENTGQILTHELFGCRIVEEVVGFLFQYQSRQSLQCGQPDEHVSRVLEAIEINVALAVIRGEHISPHESGLLPVEFVRLLSEETLDIQLQ